MHTKSSLCPCCHTDEVDVVRNETYGHIALCSECGYARQVEPVHRLAS